MAEHNEFGKEGEEEAAAYLIDKGYSIRHRNWHCGKKELDIVASRLAFGITIGGDLEYSDSPTLSQALENRRVL